MEIRRLRRERVGLVVVENAHQVRALGAMIGHFEQRAVREEILDGRIPLLHLTVAQVSLDAVAVVRGQARGLASTDRPR